MNSLEEIINSTEGETQEAFKELIHSSGEKTKEIDRLSQHIDHLEHDIKLLKKKIYGTSSEKQNTSEIPAHDILFNEFELCAQEQAAKEAAEGEVSVSEPPKTPAASKSHKKPGRKPLPKTLPRKIVEHDLVDDEKQCHCGASMACFGTQVSEELEYHKPSLTVIEHHCKKYSCPSCKKANKKIEGLAASMKTAKKPAQLIPKSFASASLLSAIVTAKFCDYLPLYRLENIFKRESVHLSRQTMSQWVLKASCSAGQSVARKFAHL